MVLRSPHPDVEIPDVSLAGFVLSRARELGDKPALIDGPSGRVLTYERLADDVELAAAGLAERGFCKGDVFAIHSPNVPEYAVAFLAVASLGGAVTTVNPLCTVDELAEQLRDSRAIHLLTVPPFLKTARAAADMVSVREVFVFGKAEGATPFAALLAGDGCTPAITIDPREDSVALLYSSGTTGRPKGVMLTHRNLVAFLRQLDGLLPTREDDTVAAVPPFIHISGLAFVMLMSLYKGATIVTMPRFDLEGFLRLVQDQRVTVGYLVPPILLALARRPVVDRYDLSSLRCIAAGGAPLGAEVERGCAERLGVPILQAFGMTETCLVSATPSDTPAEAKPGSVGPLVPNTEGRIVDPASGEDVAAGEEGELKVRGPQVMKGYLNRPDATADAIDADGWLKTGDLCRADEDGHLYVVDRLKELIKYKGWQVAPAELEAVLLSYPKVADAAVVGSPDKEAGELPKAFVVAAKGEPTAEEIVSFVAERVAPQKKVRKVEFVEEIPKSPSGKILRRVLIERERRQQAAAGGR